MKPPTATTSPLAEELSTRPFHNTRFHTTDELSNFLDHLYTRTNQHGWSKQQTDKLLLLGLSPSFVTSTITTITNDQVDAVAGLLADEDLNTANLFDSVGLTTYLRLSTKAYAAFVVVSSNNPSVAERLAYTLYGITQRLPPEICTAEADVLIEWVDDVTNGATNTHSKNYLDVVTALYNLATKDHQSSREYTQAVTERLRRARTLAATICRRTKEFLLVGYILEYTEAAIPWSAPHYDELYTAVIVHNTNVNEEREYSLHHFTSPTDVERITALYDKLSKQEQELFLLLLNTTDVSPKEAATIACSVAPADAS